DMHPLVRDEVYRIGYEAIRNACRHARSDRLDIALAYDRDLTLQVRDSGVGIDPAILESGKDGHFGLRGMKERAARINGRFRITTAAPPGTTITLVVPGRIAFRG